jgi:hypothetical protein
MHARTAMRRVARALEAREGLEIGYKGSNELGIRVYGAAEMRETAQLFRVREQHMAVTPHLAVQGDLGRVAWKRPTELLRSASGVWTRWESRACRRL